jgi:hypothetical protein
MTAWSPKTARLLTAVISIAMAVVFLYGMVRFPDAPIHECATGFCGKQGQPHTIGDYDAFRVWQTMTIFIVWPIGLVCVRDRWPDGWFRSR